jgi:hypothetical protein
MHGESEKESFTVYPIFGNVDFKKAKIYVVYECRVENGNIHRDWELN